MKNLLFVVWILSLNSIAFAQVKVKVLDSVKLHHFELATGSKVELHDVKRNEKIPATFLGKMPSHPYYGEEVLFLNHSTNEVLMVDGSEVNSTIPRTKMQPLISTIDQAGETCAAYAIYHYWQQQNEMNLKGNAELKRTFSHEFNRMKFLEESITSYYMSRSYKLDSSLKKFGQRFGLKCRERIFKNKDDALAFVYTENLKANPVVIEFNVGPDMETSPHEIVDRETGARKDTSIWIPRKKGARKSGGHVVVSVAAFKHNNEHKVMILDSNWNEPRIWNLDKYLPAGDAIEEMNFHVCE